MYPELLKEGPEPSARSLVLAVVLMHRGEAEVTVVTRGLADGEEEDWDEKVRGALVELTGAGMLVADGDRVKLRLDDEAWRRLAGDAGRRRRGAGGGHGLRHDTRAGAGDRAVADRSLSTRKALRKGLSAPSLSRPCSTAASAPRGTAVVHRAVR